jgi:hypothetical protein
MNTPIHSTYRSLPLERIVLSQGLRLAIYLALDFEQSLNIFASEWRMNFLLLHLWLDHSISNFQLGYLPNAVWRLAWRHIVNQETQFEPKIDNI